MEIKQSLVAEAIEQDKPSSAYTYTIEGYDCVAIEMDDGRIIIRSPVRLTVTEEKR